MTALTQTPSETQAQEPGRNGAASGPPAPASPAPGRHGLRRLLLAVSIVAGIVATALLVAPKVRRVMTTVSTDDAYVNAHVTQVAPRIGETVVAVLVDDNDFVRKGDLLVTLDRDVEQTAVEQAEAALSVARRAVEQQQATARALAATAIANLFKLESAMTSVRNQITGLRTAIAKLDEARAAERLAQIELDRSRRLGTQLSETQEQVQIRQADYDTARARSRQALEQIYQTRVALELPERAPGQLLDAAPNNLDQRHSSVMSALGAFAQTLADLGLELPRHRETPDAYVERLKALAPRGDIDVLIEQTAAQAPGVASARAMVERAEKDLAMARLNLSYCEVRADIDGFISNRNVNPGDRVAPGQRLMAIRAFHDTWIDCNFKETQLEPIRIGQPVDVTLDAYPGKVFRGRVSGFSPGTGASTALLPAENATGNFVKIVQRLSVRVDLVDGNPPDTPLFCGLSVVPHVRIYDRPDGPHAGRRLRADVPVSGTGAPGGEAASLPSQSTEYETRPSTIGLPSTVPGR